MQRNLVCIKWNVHKSFDLLYTCGLVFVSSAHTFMAPLLASSASEATRTPCQYNDSISIYGDSHYKDETVVTASDLYYGNISTGKVTYLYKKDTLDTCRYIANMKPIGNYTWTETNNVEQCHYEFDLIPQECMKKKIQT